MIRTTLSSLMATFPIMACIGCMPALAVPQDNQEPVINVLPAPNFVLPVHTESAEKTASIKALIAHLVEIDRPDFGLSATMSGSAFAPVPGSEQAGAFVFGNHGLHTSSAFLELVKLGPLALPCLLASLDDHTPTKLVMKRQGILMWTEYGRELLGNPGNRAERIALVPISRDKEHFTGEGPKEHVVTVGDVCFVIIGQIVGRPYRAVRYQPTGGLIINSPTHDPLIARVVRDIWNTPNPRQYLLNSLLLDYSSRGVYNKAKDSLDAWDIGSDLQVAAAMRLLYYFPKQAAPLISRRLNKLKVNDVTMPETAKKGHDLDKWEARELANEVRTERFIKAIAWSQRAEIQSVLATVFRRTDDPEIAVTCLTGQITVPTNTIRNKLSTLLRRHSDDDGPGATFGTAYHLLLSLGRFGGAEAKPTFKKFLRRRLVDRIRTMIHVLREIRHEWACEMLGPFLRDKRTFGWDYPVNQEQNAPRLPIRICDEAAETLARTTGTLKFRMEGTHADLNKQIQLIRKQIKDGNHKRTAGH